VILAFRGTEFGRERDRGKGSTRDMRTSIVETKKGASAILNAQKRKEGISHHVFVPQKKKNGVRNLDFVGKEKEKGKDHHPCPLQRQKKRDVYATGFIAGGRILGKKGKEGTLYRTPPERNWDGEKKE